MSTQRFDGTQSQHIAPLPFRVTPVVLPSMSEIERMRLDEQMRVRASCGAFNRPAVGYLRDRMHFEPPKRSPPCSPEEKAQIQSEYSRLKTKRDYWCGREKRLRRPGYVERLRLEGRAWTRDARYLKPVGDDARFVRWCMAYENVSTLSRQIIDLLWRLFRFTW